MGRRNRTKYTYKYPYTRQDSAELFRTKGHERAYSQTQVS